MPCSRVIGMRMGDHRTVNRAPRVNVEVTWWAIQALRTANNQFHFVKHPKSCAVYPYSNCASFFGFLSALYLLSACSVLAQCLAIAAYRHPSHTNKYEP
jgi:hypothetical protein